MLKCERLHKAFGDKTAVADLSFSVKEGEIFALLGSNGAGKSTTIKMILALLPKDAGEIIIKPGAAIGYSPESPVFSPVFTAGSALRYYCELQGIAKADIPKEISRVLALTGLEDSKTKIKNFSKGMLQRLAVAQSLLGSPDFLILDEPTSGLDALGRVEMIRLLRDLKKQGMTILLNSHILSDVEQVSDRALIMHSGRKMREWTAAEESRSLEEVFIEAVGGTAL